MALKKRTLLGMTVRPYLSLSDDKLAWTGLNGWYFCMCDTVKWNNEMKKKYKTWTLYNVVFITKLYEIFNNIKYIVVLLLTWVGREIQKGNILGSRLILTQVKSKTTVYLMLLIISYNFVKKTTSVKNIVQCSSLIFFSSFHYFI